jgi:hypothetical protein
MPIKLAISGIPPTLPVTLGFQLSIEGCSATIKSTYLALSATKTELAEEKFPVIF